jgi:hypothetical protein
MFNNKCTHNATDSSMNTIKSIPAGSLYISGHTLKGYAIERQWADAEVSQHGDALDAVKDEGPLRFFATRGKASALVARWNRRFASH